MSFLQRAKKVVADAKISIYIGWYSDKDPEFGQQLDAGKPSAALWKLKGTSADLAKAAQHVEKEHKDKGVVLSFPTSMSVVDAKKQVIKAVKALIVKKGLKPTDKVEAGWSYPTSELILSLIEKNHSKPFNSDTIHKIQSVWLDVKSKDGEGAVAPQIVGHKSSGILTRADEIKGRKREIVVTLSVPKGYQADYTKAIQKALPEFKVEKLAKSREPKVVEKTSAKASYIQNVAKVKVGAAEYDISFELTTENRGSIKKDVSKEFHKAIESALKAQSLKLTNAIHCGHNHCYTETKEALDPQAVLNHLKKVLDLSGAEGDVYLLIRETELTSDAEKDASLPGQEIILFEPIKAIGL